MVSGQVVSNVDAILRNGLVKAGIRNEYENVTGYMLGLYGRTPRSSDFSHVFLPTSQWRLKTGMVFHMYTSADGIGISETVLVTDTGGERLTQSPREVLVSSK
jgi:Xaa-Pro dipeptidase